MHVVQGIGMHTEKKSAISSCGTYITCAPLPKLTAWIGQYHMFILNVRGARFLESAYIECQKQTARPGKPVVR
jgi:hypothetical protein